MKYTHSPRRRLALAIIAIGLLVAPATAQTPELAMLNGLSDGLWQITIRGQDSSKRVCLRTGRELIQIRHERATCSQVVVEDQASQVTVQYSCPGNGYGRTTIRRETSQLAQVDSQGIEGGLPFHFNGEARRIGSC